MAPEFYPDWAEIDKIVSGSPNKVRPQPVLRDDGYAPDEVPTSQELNWQLNNIAQWIKDFDSRLINQAISLEDVYPVGSLYFNGSNATTPATLLGFGTWEAYGQGTAIIGAGSNTDNNGETREFIAENEYGQYKHTLTIDEMPSHVHTTATFAAQRTPGYKGLGTWDWDSGGVGFDNVTNAAGSNHCLLYTSPSPRD